MTDMQSHDRWEQLLPAAALEILDPEELLGLSAHVQQCAGCARLLDSYREVVAGLATSLPEQSFPLIRSDRVRARLLARAAGGRSSAVGTAPVRRPSGWVQRWGGWAVAAGMAGVLLMHHSVHRPIAYGWLIAGVLLLLVVGLGVYLQIQRARVAAMEEQLKQRSSEDEDRSRGD